MESKDNLKEYKMLADVLENYGELGEIVAQNPFLMIDLVGLIKHPRGGLVELDYDKIMAFSHEYGDRKDFVKEIIKRFAQREIKYPARKEIIMYDGRPKYPEYVEYNKALDDIKKLNPDTKEN